MRLKYYTLASSWFLALFVALNARGQAAPSPTPPVGYIRFWDMLPPANGAFELRKAGVPPSEATLLNGTPLQYSSYTEFPAGKYKLAVFKKGERNTPLKLLDLDVRQESFFTILITPKGGVQTVEMTEDTLDPKATSGVLTIRNFFPGSIVGASIKGTKLGSPLPYGESYVAAGLPTGRVSVGLSVRLPTGDPIETGIEPDFKVSKRATLLIIPDSYGRLSPIITFDGKN
jgi:hypothetical protein